MNAVLCLALNFGLTSAVAAAGLPRPDSACWLETSASSMPGALGGTGLRDTKVWNSTISSVLVRHPRGDILIDAGLGPDAQAQMDELPPASRAFGLQIVAGAKDRKTILQALATVGEPPGRIARILVTHAHYDHLGGATEVAGPIYVAPAEAAWMADQAARPTIMPPSLIAAVKSRLTVLAYDSGPYLGFDRSKDVYGDGRVVVVPLPGHTPGSQGVFLKLGRRRVFLIGAAADTLEAAERGLPKSAPIRTATDFEPKIADRTAERVSIFHAAHPEIALIPSHDRTAFAAVFGAPGQCVSNLDATTR